MLRNLLKGCDLMSEGEKRLKEIPNEVADKVLENGPEYLCTLHKKLRVPCDNTCGILDNWEKEHEKCTYRVHKSQIVFGRIFGKENGWIKK